MLTFTPFMSQANQEKTVRGHAVRSRLEEILYRHLHEGRLSAVRKNFRIGKAGYGNPRQFFAPFLVQFADGDRWIVYSTSSMRDRVKEQLWDAFNIKEADASVVAAYLTYPSVAEGCDEAEIPKFEKKHEQYVTGDEYSSLDGVIGWDELDRLIEEKADAYYAALYAAEVSTAENGKRYDFLGRAFEREIAETLSDPANLAWWKTGKGAAGRHGAHFAKMLACFGFEPSQVVAVRATANRDDIGDLPSGGSPKTDVIVGVTLAGGDEVIRTVSCKRVTGHEVSVHQYTADAFADVLDKDNEALRRNLKYFQMAGNFADMPGGSAELAKEIAPYVEKLCRWAVGGYGGDGDEKQKAQYLVAYRPSDNAFAVHSVDEYVALLLARPSTRQPGTPFSWTYQGRRGKNIQLKMPVIF